MSRRAACDVSIREPRLPGLLPGAPRLDQTPRLAVLLAPVPARLKEWAYAGFALNIASAIMIHPAMGEGPEVWSRSVGAGLLWVLW